MHRCRILVLHHCFSLTFRIFSFDLCVTPQPKEEYLLIEFILVSYMYALTWMPFSASRTKFDKSSRQLSVLPLLSPFRSERPP
jgi:hypothetical protein